MIGNKERQEFENALAGFLETGGIDLLKWFIKIDDANEANLLHSETIVNSFWSAFVRNEPHDTEVFEYLVKAAPLDRRNLIGSLLSSLIKTKDPNQYKTLLMVYREKHGEWPVEITSSVRKACMEVAMETGFPNNVQLLELVLDSLDSSSEQAESIAQNIVSWVVNDDINMRNEGVRLLRLINERSRRRKPFAIQECVDKVKELLVANNESARTLLEYIFSYLDKLTAKQEIELTDLIREQITVNKPNQMRLLALDYVPRLITDLNKRDILKEVLELAKTAEESDTKEKCKAILKEFKRYLSRGQVKETKALFGDTVFEVPT